MVIFWDLSEDALLRGKSRKQIFESALTHRKSLFSSFFTLFWDFFTFFFAFFWQWSQTTTEKTIELWKNRGFDDSALRTVILIGMFHCLGCNYCFFEMFYIFVAFLWQRRQTSTEKIAWRKISTFSKRFAKQFTSSTTFLFRDFDHFFLGQFTTRTNFQRCKFYWNSLAEVPQNHDKKDAFFRNLPVKRSQKTVKNTKNTETSKSDKFGNLETWPKNS